MGDRGTGDGGAGDGGTIDGGPKEGTVMQVGVRGGDRWRKV